MNHCINRRQYQKLLAQFFIEKRTLAGVTMKDAADFIMVDDQIFQEFEEGHRQLIPHRLYALAMLYGVSRQEFNEAIKQPRFWSM